MYDLTQAVVVLLINTTVAMPQPPRISFSGDFGQANVIAKETNKAAPATYDPDFEFIPTSEDSDVTMLPADELFLQGRLAPFWPSTHQSSKLEKVAGINVALNGAGATKVEGRKLDQYGHEVKERSDYNMSTTHGSMNCGSSRLELVGGRRTVAEATKVHRSMEGVVETKEAAVVGGDGEGREEEEEGIREDEICKCED